MMPSPKKQFLRLPLFWRLQIVIWSGYFVHGCFSRTGYYDHAAMGVGMSLLLEPTEMILSSGLRLIYRRLDMRVVFSLRVLGIIFIMSLAATLLQLVVAKFGAPWVAHLADYHARPSSLVTRVSYFMLIYIGWSVAYVWMKGERSAQEARVAAQLAEVQMLRLQLNPHFMFNSLNNIATQIPDQADTALEMTHGLADFLRHSFDPRVGLIGTLSHEVEVMTSYLKIEQLRFGDRLSYSLEVDENAARVRIPSFLLQPIAENAVKHGLKSSPPPWQIKIRAYLDGADLHISLHNTGKLMPDQMDKPATGIGIANLRRRLQLHYPSRHRFDLRQEGGFICAELILKGEPCPV